MLWGQKLIVYTDHKNLISDALGSTSDRITRQRLLLEEFDPKLEYIKGNENIVADVISRLEYDENINPTNGNPTEGQSVKHRNYLLTKLFSWYLTNEECELAHASEFEKNIRMIRLSSDAPYTKESEGQASIKAAFDNNSENVDEIYPLLLVRLQTHSALIKLLKIILHQVKKLRKGLTVFH